jgi:hypothetical protein
VIGITVGRPPPVGYCIVYSGDQPMNTLRAHLSSFVLLVLLALAGAVQPAIAQQTRIVRPPGHRQKIPPGKNCSDCHKGRYAEWKAGPHGDNQVNCDVCHGNVTESFTAKPKVSVCEQCHAELVAQLKSDPFMKGKTCVSCHPPHALKPHKKVASAGK